LKKIGILTYHACFNYGACLQAYALQQTIMKYQPDCEIIDYQSDILRNISDVFSKKITHPKELVKNITRSPYYTQLKKRQELFEKFINDDLIISECCKNENDVEKQVKNYECIVCGSDQTWNLDPSIRYQNLVYYLNFPKNERRVTYATSFGQWIEKVHEHEEEILPWIDTYDLLSMREESGVQYLREKGFKCEHVLDPTFLLDVSEYDKICSKPIINEPYVLMFSWNGAKEVIQATKLIAKKLKCKAINIIPPPRSMFCGIERKLDVGPREFLSLIKNARCIVTNSFHGTVFSTIYEKPFVSVVSGVSDTRRHSLMKSIGLSDRLLKPDEIDLDKIMNSNFENSKILLENLKEKSLNYLIKAISIEEEMK